MKTMVLLFSAIVIMACEGNDSARQAAAAMAPSVEGSAPADMFPADSIRAELALIAAADRDTGEVVAYLKQRYAGGNGALFSAGKEGAQVQRAAVAILCDAYLHGISADSLGMAAVEDDVKRMLTMGFADGTADFLHLLARVDYNISKAYLTYVAGLRYGFLRPHSIFNRLDKRPRSEDPTGKKFRILFNVDTERPDSNFFATAVDRLYGDSLTAFIASIAPDDSLYLRLQKELLAADSAGYRAKILCNMERCRWRNASPLGEQGKHIVVNIPAQHLYAYGGDTLLDMRIVCGTKKNKTPLLKSNIERLEVNPLWIVPTNIIKNEIAYHAGDSAYFAKNDYVITHKETDDTIDAATTTVKMLRSGNYSIVQRRGPGNSLGRVVFRFNNPFSVFLHDTNSRGAFRRPVRTLSHGCVRVEKPLDLAIYCLEGENEWTLDKLRISMDFPPESEQGKKWLKEKEEELAAQQDSIAERPLFHSLMGRKELRGHVPLCITYYTIYYDSEGRLQSYPDRYGYDGLMERALDKFTE